MRTILSTITSRRRVIALLAALAVAIGMAWAIPAQAQVAPISTSNWSGYVTRVHPMGDGQFIYVTGTWTVPHISPRPLRAVLGQVSIWVGLGGVSGDGTNYTPLVQVATVSGLAFSKAYVKTGDQITASVTYEDSLLSVPPGPAGQYLVQMQDVRNGTQVWNYTHTVQVSDTRTPTSAEWIVEQPNIIPPGYQVPLANFGSIYINGGYVGYPDTTGAYVSDDQYVQPHTTVSGFDGHGGFTVTYNP
jgi:hypothetical protein